MDTILREAIAAAGRSKYPALADGLRKAIADGTLKRGEKLPPVRDLAYRLSLTPGTVARAYAVLTDERLLVGEVGRGTFVAEAPRHNTDPSRIPPQNAADTGHPDPLFEMPERAHFLSPRLPDKGQGELIRRGLATIARDATDEDLVLYPGAASALPAREAFLAQIEDLPVGPADVADIFVGHGGQHVILTILQTVLKGPDPVIAVDALSYGGFRSAALLCRAEVIGVPWDDEGPDPARFEALIREHGVQVFCTSAEVNNPTLGCATPARRRQIAEIATRHGVHVIDDECYQRDQRVGPSYRALMPDLGWFVTSPSKGMSAALRIGFGVAPKAWSSLAQRAATFSSFGVSRLITDLYAWLRVQPETPDILAQIRSRMADGVRTAVNALGGYTVAWNEGVPFVWVELPLGWRAQEYCEAARSSGVLIKSAEDYAMRDSRQVHAVRIAINGRIDNDAFAQSMARLRALLDAPPQRIST